ncbi:tyrosine-type recombinase/integrase [Polynucleobacter antarcticus]|uniref:Integrase n=1 Tax=Polynucleobacter antarcticus TaxID=1743162 RepID=A0A6M9PPZ8_9BURK|nr:site-specific integrase [Polynucleobacter antarcticus]QKM62649.1 integrase [Polynucleobacter antarcticus]
MDINSGEERSKGQKSTKFTARGILAINHPGWYADPESKGLYLRVFEGCDELARCWLYRFTSPVSGKRRAMGLGSLRICSLATARQKSLDLRRVIFEGVDPIEQRQAKQFKVKESHQHSITFKDAADRCIKTKQAEWSNSKHKDQWVSTINTYALPIIGKLKVDQITTAHIVKLLEQDIKKKDGTLEGSFWKVRTETATRVRQRIEVILDWCKAHKYITGDNPARYQGALCHLLPKASKIKKVVHHPALPFQRVGEFMKDLRAHSGYSASALELLTLTATRTSEVIEAQWDEFDLGKKVWTIPAERMKAGKEHRVPLNTRTMEILDQLKTIRVNSYLFPSFLHKERPLSNMALLTMMRKMPKYSMYVPHGFRSTFRDWAAETTEYSNETVELALAHSIQNKAEAAYRRQDQLDKRSLLMADWQNYIDAGINAFSQSAAHPQIP